MVKQRLDEDDFIEDDDGSGYVDNGMDDFDRPSDEDDDEDEDASDCRPLTSWWSESHA